MPPPRPPPSAFAPSPPEISTAAKPVRRSPVVDPRQPKPSSPHITPYIPRLVQSHLGKDEPHPVKGTQKAMFKAMSKALAIPHFGYNDEVNITSLVSLRSAMKAAAAERGINFSYMPIFVKVCIGQFLSFISVSTVLPASSNPLPYITSFWSTDLFLMLSDL